MTRYLLFWPESGEYAGETGTEIGVKRKAAELQFGDEKHHFEIEVEPDEHSTLWLGPPCLVATYGGVEVLVAQPEHHPDVEAVAWKTKREMRGD